MNDLLVCKRCGQEKKVFYACYCRESFCEDCIEEHQKTCVDYLIRHGAGNSIK